MKRIIDGLKYDTETATRLHEWDNGIFGNDFRSHEETLFKTPKGRYYVYGCSGPMGPYAQSIGNNGMGAGDVFIPMDREQAFRWLSDHDGVDVAETEFSDLITEA
jgi:hypothetical protein